MFCDIPQMNKASKRAVVGHNQVSHPFDSFEFARPLETPIWVEAKVNNLFTRIKHPCQIGWSICRPTLQRNERHVSCSGHDALLAWSNNIGARKKCEGVVAVPTLAPQVFQLGILQDGAAVATAAAVVPLEAFGGVKFTDNLHSFNRVMFLAFVSKIPDVELLKIVLPLLAPLPEAHFSPLTWVTPHLQFHIEFAGGKIIVNADAEGSACIRDNASPAVAGNIGAAIDSFLVAIPRG